MAEVFEEGPPTEVTEAGSSQDAPEAPPEENEKLPVTPAETLGVTPPAQAPTVTSSPRKQRTRSTGNLEPSKKPVLAKQLSAPIEAFPTDVAKYSLHGLVGRGAFASVYKAYCTPLDLEVAIKVIELETGDRDIFEKVAHETQTMLALRHQNVLQIHACFVYKNEAWAVLPLLITNCYDVLKNFDSGLDEDSVCTIVKDVTNGLEYLHKKNLVHSDLKSSNILLDNKGEAKIADFGVTSSLISIGQLVPEKLHEISGTVHYMAPEVARSQGEGSEGYDGKADIWSLGITCIELLCGKPPRADLSRTKAMMAILSEPAPTVDEYVKNKTASKLFKQFVHSCLHLDSAERKSASELIDSTYLQKPTSHEKLSNMLCLGADPSPYFRLMDPDAVPKSLMVEEEKEEEEGWNFTAESDTIQQIAEMAARLEAQQKAEREKQVEEVVQSAGESMPPPAKAPTNKKSSTKKHKKSDNCVIS